MILKRSRDPSPVLKLFSTNHWLQKRKQSIGGKRLLPVMEFLSFLICGDGMKSSALSWWRALHPPQIKERNWSRIIVFFSFYFLVIKEKNRCGIMDGHHNKRKEDGTLSSDSEWISVFFFFFCLTVQFSFSFTGPNFLFLNGWWAKGSLSFDQPLNRKRKFLGPGIRKGKWKENGW